MAAYLSRQRDAKRSLGSVEDDDGLEDQWTHAAASAGELWVRLGLLRTETSTQEWGESYVQQREDELRQIAERVLKACDGLGGTLGAIASVLHACLTNEFLKAKYVIVSYCAPHYHLTGTDLHDCRVHLREALKTATSSGDNHLRALILALIAAQYLNTSSEHAEAMLATSEQLAAGLGAQPRPAKDKKGVAAPVAQGKSGDGVGNAPLRLWIGERSLGS